MQYTIESDDEFLRVRVSGRDADRPPSEVCAAVLSESTKRGRNRILIELDQKSPLSATSQFQLVTRLPELGFTPRHRTALVHSTPQLHEPDQFINLIPEIPGIPVRNFQRVQIAND